MSTKRKFLPSSLAGAILVHVVVVLFFIIGLQLKPDHANHSISTAKAVVAQVIDGDAVERERKRRLQQQQQKVAAEQERKRKLEEAKRAEQERKKQLEEQKRKQQEEAEKKLAEERRLAEEAQRAAEEKQRKAAEAEKLALEKQRQLEEEKKRLEEQRKAAEAERKRLEEQKRLAAEQEKKRLEEQRRLEQERLEREKEQEQKYLSSILDEELDTITADEERIESVSRQREMDRMTQEYAAILTSHIQNRWRRPNDFKAGTVCTVNIVQTIGGYIESLKISKCTGNEAFKKSVEEAVYKAEPLPAPPAEEVFEREIKITFEPE